MSDCVALLGGRALPRLALTGLAIAWLSGCSSDVTRFAQSPNPFSNPFSSGQTASTTPAAPVSPVASAPLAPPSAVASATPTGAGRSAPPPVGGTAAGWTAVGGSPIVVAQGETVDSLSSRYGVPTAALLSANGLSSPAEVHGGMRIVVPVYHANAAVAEAKPSRKETKKEMAETSAKPDKKHERGTAARDDKEKSDAHSAAGKLAEKDKSAPLSHAGKSASEKPAPVVAKAEPSKAQAQSKKPEVDAAPTSKVDKDAAEAKATTSGAQADASAAGPEFRWPARGRIIEGFKAGGNDGINISVPAGTSVRAAENGVVVYAGDGLKGYGNLVLIKHPNGFVSAYGNNGELDVKRGETVKRGQIIAKSGDTGNVNAPQLHFELRKGSTPVDPTQYLAGL
jgi:murein DD-endopeptidase MepM/ murein hydrolase activator NlpD